MQVLLLDSSQTVARRAADAVCRQIERKPDSVLGLATGGTPLALYGELIRRHQAGQVSFKDVTTFNLDEYVGLASEHPRSYRAFMQSHLFNHIDIDPERTHLPDGLAANPLAEGADYEAKIEAAGGIDLQVLGIGRDGHIAFNMPTSSLVSRTRIKTLTNDTLEDNQRFFKTDEFQPHLALTMGIGTILDARHIVLLATGFSKSSAIADMVEGPVSALCPASALQMHNKVQVLIDNEAAANLNYTRYYQLALEEQDALEEKFGHA